MTRRTRLLLDAALAAALFWASHAAYRSSNGVVQLCDSAYALVVAEQYLKTGSTDLRPCVPADPDRRKQMPRWVPGHDLPYQLVRHPNPNDLSGSQAVYFGYPLGTTVLSAPWVRQYTARGLSLFHPDGMPNEVAEGKLQVRVASQVSAAVVVLTYFVCRFLCPPAVAFLIAAGFAFASPVWSTLARALWSHTWMALWLTAAIGLLLTARRVLTPTWRTDSLLGVGMGTCLFWMVFCRQHGVVSAAAIGLYLLLHHRRLLVLSVASGAAWSAALVAVSLHAFGSVQPPSVYQPDTIDGQDVLNRFAWLMVSPSRGLLVYCPYVLVVGVMLFAFRRSLVGAGLLVPIGVAVGLHTAIFSAYNGWHAGASFGPRYFCDILPWFALATALAARAALDEQAMKWRKVVLVSLLAAGFGWGYWVHSRGARSQSVWWWNFRSIAVGQERAVKEWAHPQFLAGIRFHIREDGSVRYK